MSLETAYNSVKGTLRPQVQGTCGLYSFYNAVQIMRAIDPKLPAVPSPKKSEGGTGGFTESLRHYAKRQLQSGQGEILTEAEMNAFIKAWGYRSESSGAKTSGAKGDFMTIQTRAGHPVLIAYLADQDSTGVVPVPNAASGDPGAHWSLVIGTKDKDAKVVEPNDPGNLRTWAVADLLLANTSADAKKFARHWAKITKTPSAAAKLINPRWAPPKHEARGIEPVANPKAWTPSPLASTSSPYLDEAKPKLYDLGGSTGSRHQQQKLAHVVIALLPP